MNAVNKTEQLSCTPQENPSLLDNCIVHKGVEKVDHFKTSIKLFIQYAEYVHFNTCMLSFISKKFNLQKRRLYDMVNVLKAVGCCKKASTNCLCWLGLANIKCVLVEMKEKAKKLSIDVLFPDEKSISIIGLTSSFMLLFFVKNTNTLSLKESASFLSRKNGRYKTTVCKLYQIAYILDAIGVIMKSSAKSGEFILADCYFYCEEETEPTIETIDTNKITSLYHLLNRPIK